MCSVIRSAQWAEMKATYRLAKTAPVDVLQPIGPYGDGVFIRAVDGEMVATAGQWGMIAPGARSRRPEDREVRTTHARIETVATRATFRRAWLKGQRCLIPLASYVEPNWETGRNIPWEVRRADGAPWSLAGIWDVWIDPGTGETVYSYAMLTQNCDGHPFLGRLHRPKAGAVNEDQDKRAPIHITCDDWDLWLMGSVQDARALVKLPPASEFDQTDAKYTDDQLAFRCRRGASGASHQLTLF